MEVTAREGRVRARAATEKRQHIQATMAYTTGDTKSTVPGEGEGTPRAVRNALSLVFLCQRIEKVKHRFSKMVFKSFCPGSKMIKIKPLIFR
jgi:hypothetical protein